MRALLLALALGACSTPAPDMSAFEPFMGCWSGAFEGQTGISDERCFERLGAHVVDHHRVEPTTYSGETTYHVDDAQNEIVFAYAASDGGRSNGVAAPQSDGSLVFPPHTYRGADGAEQRLRSTWRFDGADRWRAVSEREEGGVWRPLMTITYARARVAN